MRMRRPSSTYLTGVLALATLLLLLTFAPTPVGADTGSSSERYHNVSRSLSVRSSLGRAKNMTRMAAKGIRPGSAGRNITQGKVTKGRELSSGILNEPPSVTKRFGAKSEAAIKDKDVNLDIRTTEQKSSSIYTEDIKVGCKELRARSYISDGFCTSETAVQEVVCAGQCLPVMDLPWYSEFIKLMASSKLHNWQCVEDLVRRKTVKLLCQDGTARHYKIKVVKSCKCKKMTNKHNQTTRKRKGNHKSDRRGS